MRTNFQIEDFRLFVNIADTQSLTRGADRSFISVPAASHRVKKMEENLGIKLLVRTPRGMTLTQAGRVYLKHAQKVLSQLEQFSGALQPYADGVQGSVRLAVNTTAMTEFVPDVLGRYLSRNPNIMVEARELLSSEIVTRIASDTADIGIISGDVVTDDVATMHLTTNRLVVIVPRQHELASRDAVNFREILDYDYVALATGAATQSFLDAAAEALHTRLRKRVEASGYDAIRRMVAAGAGVSIIPNLTVERLRLGDECVVLELDELWAEREFQLCLPEGRKLPTFTQALVEDLLAFFETSTITQTGS